MSLVWKPRVGMKVRLSESGWKQGIVRSREDAKCAQETVITAVDWTLVDYPDFCVIEVEGSLNRYMLNSDMFEPVS